MDPGEHIEAAKACAFVFVDEGRPNKAVSTFIAALRKHPATASIITADKQAVGLEAALNWRLLRARLDQQLLTSSVLHYVYEVDQCFHRDPCAI